MKMKAVYNQRDIDLTGWRFPRSSIAGSDKHIDKTLDFLHFIIADALEELFGYLTEEGIDIELVGRCGREDGWGNERLDDDPTSVVVSVLSGEDGLNASSWSISLREVVREMLSDGPIDNWREFLPIREGFFEIVEMIDKAVKEGEEEDARWAAEQAAKKKAKRRKK